MIDDDDDDDDDVDVQDVSDKQIFYLLAKLERNSHQRMLKMGLQNFWYVVLCLLHLALYYVVSSKQTKPCAFFEVISHSRILYEAMQLKKGTRYEKCFENLFCLVKSLCLAITLKLQCGTIVSRIILLIFVLKCVGYLFILIS